MLLVHITSAPTWITVLSLFSFFLTVNRSRPLSFGLSAVASQHGLCPLLLLPGAAQSAEQTVISALKPHVIVRVLLLLVLVCIATSSTNTFATTYIILNLWSKYVITEEYTWWQCSYFFFGGTKRGKLLRKLFQKREDGLKKKTCWVGDLH